MGYRQLFKILIISGLFFGVISAQAQPLAEWLQPPANLSGWLDNSFIETRLEMGDDGTLAVFWIEQNSSTKQWALWSRVREPDQAWTTVENLSGWLDPILLVSPTFWDAAVAPDGTVWVVWTAIDSGTVGDNQFVRAAYRVRGGSWIHQDPSEYPATNIRNAKLAMGSDGELAAVWVECAKLTPIEEGPCMLNVKRRAPAVQNWESLERIDDGWPNTGITNIQPLVGPGGLVVVLWVENNTLDTSKWGVMARAFDPGSGNWSAKYVDPISGWFEKIWLGEPVMELDGTTIAAWSEKDPVWQADTIYSSTRPVSSGKWDPKTQISFSSGVKGSWMEAPKLAVGEDGTVAAAFVNCWKQFDCEVYANDRYSGTIFGSLTKLASNLVAVPTLDVGVWPNGNAMVVWTQQDASQPAHIDTRLYWSLRTPQDKWGTVGSGHLGDWIDNIIGMDFGIGHDQSAVLAWTVFDSNRLFGQQYGIQAAVLTPSGTWEEPKLISDGYSQLAYLDEGGLVVGPSGQPVAATWYTVRSELPPEAVLFNEIVSENGKDHNIFLPMVCVAPKKLNLSE